MHISLMKTLSDFFEETAESLENLSCNPNYCPESLKLESLAVTNTLTDIVKNGRAFQLALSDFAETGQSSRNPEKLRTATTSLVRTMESFKRHYSRLYPQSKIRKHPLVGCLYGYAQPRTATLDKAALVAQETMLDIWFLNEKALARLARSTESHYEIMSRSITEVKAIIANEEVRLEAVA